MGTNTMALIQTCQIQAIMTVPQRLSFSAGLGTPHKHNRFQYTVPSHIESCAAHSAGVRGSEAKNPAFCNGRHMAKKTQVQ